MNTTETKLTKLINANVGATATNTTMDVTVAMVTMLTMVFKINVIANVSTESAFRPEIQKFTACVLSNAHS
jgi:hypothetical protein